MDGAQDPVSDLGIDVDFSPRTRHGPDYWEQIHVRGRIFDLDRMLPALRDREVSAIELLDLHLKRIEQ